MAEKLGLAVFISGRGSNMQTIVKACSDPEFPAQVNLVLSNRPDAKGLAFAASQGISCEVVDHKAFDSKAAFEAEILERLKQHDFDVICLAGFMRILSADFIKNYTNRILNIHPSLLPDYKGLDTHKRVLEDGCDKSGCTVHYVVPDVDAGPIIVQKTVPVLEGDTEETLCDRVLEQEYKAYVEAIRIVAEKMQS